MAMDDFFIDTHAHLDMIKKKQPSEVIEGALKNKVDAIINVGSSITGSRKSVFFAKEFTNVFATVGVHPHDASSFDKGAKKVLMELLSEDKNNRESHLKKQMIVAVGETGFDYFRNLSPKKDQLDAFVFQVELAIENSLPIIIHDRDAHEEIIDVIKTYHNHKGFKAVMHCFSADADFALRCLELGLFLSFTGVVTFPNAKDVKQAAKEVPLEKIFLETDAPFLAPQAKRGAENYPEYVKYIAQEIAFIKGIDLDEVARVTTKNAIDFFKLKIAR
jgi:TatD DNase family protein